MPVQLGAPGSGSDEVKRPEFETRRDKPRIEDEPSLHNTQISSKMEGYVGLGFGIASPVSSLAQDPDGGANTKCYTNLTKWFSDFWHKIVRKGKLKAKYPPETDRLLFQESQAAKILPPTAVAITLASVSGGTLEPLKPLLFFLLLIGVMCLTMGEAVKTKVPELAVVGMLGSHGSWHAALVTVALNLMGDSWMIWLVYLLFLSVFIKYFFLVHEIITKGVREPEEGA